MSDQQPVDQMSFEDAMKEREGGVSQLERGDVPLDQSIALYERGARLKARCEQKLKEAEEKVAEPDGPVTVRSRDPLRSDGGRTASILFEQMTRTSSTSLSPSNDFSVTLEVRGLSFERNCFNSEYVLSSCSFRSSVTAFRPLTVWIC